MTGPSVPSLPAHRLPACFSIEAETTASVTLRDLATFVAQARAPQKRFQVHLHSATWKCGSEPGTVFVLSKPDKELPELTAKMLSRAVLKRGGKPVGRPPSDNPKIAISLRLSAEILSRWRASGPGWQTRMAAVIAKKAP